ncbi:MAG TPA: kinase [Deltaproteobacteria bacterium]|nr:MAG: kinase [Deltaproteobacteria bacterium GWA2_45_12]HBF13178.1 kinase [Deltaproteobacteria bacterium]
MPDISSLNVFLYDEPVGVLTFLPGEQTIFSFSQAYIDNPSRPVLSLSFKDSFGELITDVKPSRIQLPPFFSNLLPEGHLRDYLARRADVNAKREFFLLWVLGHDLPGALKVEPADGKTWPPSVQGQAQVSHKDALRFSLAGVQMKFSAVAGAKGGLTIPAEGVGGSWIVKLPSMRFADVPENEYSMMTLAKSIGMDIPEIRLVDLNKIKGLPTNMGQVKGQALAVRRFDRTDKGPVHMEDFAQVFGVYPDEKYKKGSYKNIAEVLWQETGPEGITEFIRRLVFNTFIGNADMHLKNFSLIYPDRRNAKLSSGYDFVSTISYLNDENMALKLVKSKRMAELSLDQVSYLAAKVGLPEKLVLDTAKETVQRFRQVWQKESKHLPLTAHSIRVIEKNFQTVKLAKEVK